MTTQVMLMLADGAHALNGRLYVLAGGMRTVMAGMAYSVVVKVEVPYLDATVGHVYGLSLFDSEGEAVTVTSVTGDEQPVEFIAPRIDTGIPAGQKPGMPIDVMLAIGAPPLPLPAGQYEWRLHVDGETCPEWRVSFSVVAPPQALAA